MQGNWGTHYDYVGMPAEFQKDRPMATKKQSSFAIEIHPVTKADGKPAGWCSVAPREHFPALENSRILKPVDEQPVWSISCLFVEKNYRRQGISVALLRAAADYVKRHGGKIVEGYPTEPKKNRLPDVFIWTGIASAYQKAGFVECARRSQTRPIMRFVVKE